MSEPKYTAAGDGVLLQNPRESTILIVLTDVKIAGRSIYAQMLDDAMRRGELEVGDLLSLKPGESLRCPEAVGETVLEWIEEPAALADNEKTA